MNFEHATPDLFAALAAAQAEVENANKNSANPHFRSRYADLAEVLNSVRPVFAAHGIAIVQAPSFDGALVTVTTALVHGSGGRITSELSCVPAKSDSQGVGACATYLRRYSLAAMAGIAQEDLDGNDSAHNQPPAAKPIAQAKPAGPTKALTTVLKLIAAAKTVDELDAIKDAIRRLDNGERSVAIEAGIARKAELNTQAVLEGSAA
jgi:hypothetical protein